MEYRTKIRNTTRFLIRATLTLADNTVKNLVGDDFWGETATLKDMTSGNNSFDIGSVMINAFDFALNNQDGRFDGVSFTNARIVPEFGLQLSGGVEWLKRGKFIINKPTERSGIIPITTYDLMSLFDSKYDGGLTFPCTIQAIVIYCCEKCGVVLSTMQFPNYNFVITHTPNFDNSSYRQILMWCSQVACCYSRMNANGQLDLKWYDSSVFENRVDGGIFDNTIESSYQSGDELDGGNFFNYSSGDSVDGGDFTDLDNFHHIYTLKSPTIGTDMVLITGINVISCETDSTKVDTTVGSADYMLIIKSNPLITKDNIESIKTFIASKVIGMNFMPLKVSTLLDFSREAGDSAIISTANGNSYPCFLTNIESKMGNYQSLQCNAETPVENNSWRPSATEIKAQQISEKTISEYDAKAQYMTNMISAGFGLYPIVVPEPDGKGNKYYMADQPTLEESSSVWTWTSNGLMKSTNGGTSWAVDTFGNMLVNVLTAIGVNANWVNTGNLNLNGDGGIGALIALYSDEYGQTRVTINSTGLKVEQKTSESSAWVTLLHSGSLYSSMSGAKCTKFGIILPDQIGNDNTDNFWDFNNGNASFGNNVSAYSFTPRSLEEYKENINLLEDAISIVKDSEIYSYNLKNSIDKTFKNFGFIIGKKRNTPIDVVGFLGKGIDLYSMASINWKATQELIEKVEQQEIFVCNQQQKIDDLELRLSKFEEIISRGVS